MNRTPWTLVVGFGVAVALAGRLLAESQAPSQAGQVLALPEAPVFRSATTLVQLTLVAVDGAGHPVTDLTRDEIAGFEDERPREVAFLYSEAVGPPWTLLVAYDHDAEPIKWRVPDGQAPGLAKNTLAARF
jgi:hypothetical protein